MHAPRGSAAQETRTAVVRAALPEVPAPLPVRDRPLVEQAIVATLVYHHLLGMPLTVVEVWRFLLRPRGETFHPPTLGDVTRALENLVRDGVVVTASGFSMLLGAEPAHRVVDRLSRHARAQEKWGRLRRIVWWLQGIPFLRMVAGSGSLARDVVREGSDLDVLIVTTPGRIWTVRFLVTVLLDLFHLRRRPVGPTRDLVCLNHYLTLDALELPYHSLYTAYEVARLVPLLGEEISWAFRQANRRWMGEFLVGVLPDVASHEKLVPPSPLFRVLQWMGERVLGGRPGDALERWLGTLQMRRIVSGGERGAPGGRVVANAMRLEFHPRSPEAPILAAFNAHMDVLGLAPFGGQRDSGLPPAGE